MNNSHCVVVWDRKWRVIGYIIYDNMKYYYHVCVCCFYFNDPYNTDRIELMKLARQLRDEDWCEKLVKINYSENKVNS